MNTNKTNRFHAVWSNYSKKLIFITLVFLAACFCGTIFQRHLPPFPPDPPGYRWFYYFDHNLKQSLITIGIGVLTYGIGSFILLVINGCLIGMVLTVMVQNQMITEVFTCFLPHSLFEIPAILLSSLYPYVIWNFIVKSVKKRTLHTRLLKEEIVPIPILVTILLLIAAFLESVFTL